MGRLYMVIPFTLAKIEVHVRNVMINQRARMSGIAKFVELMLFMQNGGTPVEEPRGRRKSSVGRESSVGSI